MTTATTTATRKPRTVKATKPIAKKSNPNGNACRPTDGLSAAEMFEAPSAGTSSNAAGYEAAVWQGQSGPAQRDDAEATSPDAALEREIAQLRTQVQQLAAGAGSAPDGFRWAQDNSGKPTLRPTREHVTSLAGTCTTWIGNADDREGLLHRDAAMHTALVEIIERIDTEQKYAPLAEMARYVHSLGTAAPDMTRLDKQCTRALRRIDSINQYMATNMIKALLKQAGQDMAGALFWLEVHAQNVIKHRDALREEAAERSLLMYESSRTQALIAAQIVDWAVDNDVAFDPVEAATSYLNLRGWQLANQQSAVNRATQREYDTRVALFGHEIS